MSKLRQKKTIYNEEIIKGLILKYGFKRDYIYKSLRGERVSLYSLKMKEEYEQLVKATNVIITKQIQKL